MKPLSNLYQSNFKSLVDLKNETGRPDYTVTAYIKAIGYDAAQQTIAAALNTKPHDGRISDRNRVWALSVTSDGVGDYLPGIDSLHPAHLDQIADYMRKAERPQEATEAAETEPETVAEEEAQTAEALKLDALKAHLIETGEAAESELDELTVENCYNETWGQFEVIGNAYKVLTEDEADEEARERILDSLWAFRASFILQHNIPFMESCQQWEFEEAEKALEEMQGKLCESCGPLVKSMITDLDDFIDDAISDDGRGHFIADYDGEETEVLTDSGEWLYIYRID